MNDICHVMICLLVELEFRVEQFELLITNSQRRGILCGEFRKVMSESLGKKKRALTLPICQTYFIFTIENKIKCKYI